MVMAAINLEQKMCSSQKSLSINVIDERNYTKTCMATNKYEKHNNLKELGDLQQPRVK
jgi:hypothetical protein